MKNKRIIIVGTSCSGKTTLARKLSQILSVKHVELDAHYWGSNWCPKPQEDFIHLVEKDIEEANWIVEGNYKIVRDLVWKRANILIWLNYSFIQILLQALRRTIVRSITKEVLFSGNCESIKMSFFSKESILLWVLKTYDLRKQSYKRLIKLKDYSHLQIIEFKNRKQADKLKTINDLLPLIQSNI